MRATNSPSTCGMHHMSLRQGLSSFSARRRRTVSRMAGVSPSAKTFTPKQGQYLAYIHLYTRLHRRPPAEADIPAIFLRHTAFRSSNGVDARTCRLHQTAARRRSQYRSPRRSETPARATVTSDSTCHNHCDEVLVGFGNKVTANAG